MSGAVTPRGRVSATLSGTSPSTTSFQFCDCNHFLIKNRANGPRPGSELTEQLGRDSQGINPDGVFRSCGSDRRIPTCVEPRLGGGCSGPVPRHTRRWHSMCHDTRRQHSGNRAGNKAPRSRPTTSPKPALRRVEHFDAGEARVPRGFFREAGITFLTTHRHRCRAAVPGETSLSPPHSALRGVRSPSSRGPGRGGHSLQLRNRRRFDSRVQHEGGAYPAPINTMSNSTEWLLRSQIRRRRSTRRSARARSDPGAP